MPILNAGSASTLDIIAGIKARLPRIEAGMPSVLDLHMVGDQFLEALKTDNDPLVYAQEYLAEFVDWAGVGFFVREKLLENNQPVPYPTRCDCVFAVIDTASKTGTEHGATAVTFFARDSLGGRFPLMILDWDIVQIEGALLETWLPTVFNRLEELAQQCRARFGSLGAMIEDINSGTILLQQALLRGMPAKAINSKLTAMGKDERALLSPDMFIGRR